MRFDGIGNEPGESFPMGGILGVVFKDRGKKVSMETFQSFKGFENCLRKGGQVAVEGNVGFLAGPSLGGVSNVIEYREGKDNYLLEVLGDWCCFSQNGETEKNIQNILRDCIRSYIKNGAKVIEDIGGEMALALWDGRKQTLFVVTDRCRLYPLYYFFDHEKLVFSSRLTVLCDLLSRDSFRINPYSVINFVGFSYIPTPASIFQETRKIPPGNVLKFQQGALDIQPYWDIDFSQESQAPLPELRIELNRVLRRSIEKRLSTKDNSLEVGTFLSGGIDSSTVTGVLTQIKGAGVKAFTIRFGHEQYNEAAYARCAARAFGAKHFEYEVTPQDAFDVIPHLLSYFEEPFGNASAIPTFFCAKLAKEQGVQVLLAGDGGDELFAGNERYATQRLFDYYQLFPKWLREILIEPLVNVLDRRLPLPLFHKAQRYIHRANIPYPERLSSWGIFEVLPPIKLFHEDLTGYLASFHSQKELFEHYRRARANTELDRQLYVDLKMAISDNDLFKVVGMASAAGINVRFPFLDRAVMEFAATIPASLKMKGRQLRSFFKCAYEDLLPREILRKQKHGFGLPISYWLKTYKPFNELMHEMVLGSRTLGRHFFRRDTLEELVRLHESDRTPFFGAILWNVMMLEMWLRQYEDRKSLGSS